MDKHSLVILKGSDSISYDSDTISPNVFYRCAKQEKTPNTLTGYIVYGIWFEESSFNELFEFAYDRLMRDWATIGLIVNGKPISKTAFCKLANVHTYGKQNNNNRIILFHTHPKECMYGFYPIYCENKAKQLDAMYKWFIQTIEGYMGYVDQDNIQFGNCGVPIGFGDLRVRQIC